MRYSSRRQLILDTLRSCTNHPTAEELYGMVSEEMPSISLGTVYRNLSVLVESDEIRKFEPPGEGKARYDAKREEHAHLVCTECHTVYDLILSSASCLDEEVEELTGFTIEQRDIVLKGVCRSCRDLRTEKTAL